MLLWELQLSELYHCPGVFPIVICSGDGLGPRNTEGKKSMSVKKRKPREEDVGGRPVLNLTS